MLRVICMALMNVIPVVTTIFGAAYAVQPAYGIGFDKDVYLWIPVLGNILAVLVIPFVGNLSDKIGRSPPIIVGALRLGPARLRLSLRDQHPQRAAGDRHVAADVGRRLPGLQRGLPELLPGAVPDPDPRLGDGDHRQNIGTTITALLPALFATVAPPGSTNIPLTVGGIAFGITVIAALAAVTARETYRVHMNDLGNPDAVPVPKADYERMRAQAASGAAVAPT